MTKLSNAIHFPADWKYPWATRALNDCLIPKITESPPHIPLLWEHHQFTFNPDTRNKVTSLITIDVVSDGNSSPFCVSIASRWLLRKGKRLLNHSQWKRSDAVQTFVNRTHRCLCLLFDITFTCAGIFFTFPCVVCATERWKDLVTCLWYILLCDLLLSTTHRPPAQAYSSR